MERRARSPSSSQPTQKAEEKRETGPGCLKFGETREGNPEIRRASCPEISLLDEQAEEERKVGAECPTYGAQGVGTLGKQRDKPPSTMQSREEAAGKRQNLLQSSRVQPGRLEPGGFRVQAQPRARVQAQADEPRFRVQVQPGELINLQVQPNVPRVQEEEPRNQAGSLTENERENPKGLGFTCQEGPGRFVPGERGTRCTSGNNPGRTAGRSGRSARGGKVFSRCRDENRWQNRAAPGTTCTNEEVCQGGRESEEIKSGESPWQMGSGVAGNRGGQNFSKGIS